MKVLIVKLGSIGDVVHTLPALAAIRNALPRAEITWVVDTRAAEILRGNEYIDRLIELDTEAIRSNGSVEDLVRSLRGQVAEIRRSRYDIALDFQGLIKSAVVAKLSGSKKRWGFAGKALREPVSRILLTDAVRIPKKTHVIRKNLRLAAAALGLETLPTRFEFPVTPTDADRKEALFITSRIGDRFAILNLGGGWPTKLWDAANYGELADRLWMELGLPSVIASGPDEAELAGAVTASSSCGKTFAAQPGLKGFYELARRAAVYVGGDTGPTHLAIAAGCPVVGIFGPTEWWRNGSIVPDDICVERTDIECRVDCHRRSCSNWICMNISVDQVFDAVKLRLTKSKVETTNGDQSR